MRETRQDAVNDRVVELEAAGIETWPARETLIQSGWILRFTGGHTHRGNSVATHAWTGEHCVAAITAVEQAYRARGLAPMFQISPATRPADLDRELGLRGYRTITPTLTCVASSLIMRACLPEPREVRVGGEPDDDFIQLIIGASRSPADGHERLEILSRIELPHVCITAYDKSVPVACGTGTLAAGWVSINLMRTAGEHRRAGHARRVLAALTRWAEGKGVSRLTLNVEEGNAPARALYAKSGFDVLYASQYSRHD